MNAFAQGEGLPGMGYIFWREDARAAWLAGPIAKSLGRGADRARSWRQSGWAQGDAVFFLGRAAGEVRGGGRQGAQRDRARARG